MNDHISPAALVHSARADATRVAYARFVSGARGWLDWTRAQGVSSTALDAQAADRVAQFYYYRTDALTLGSSTGGQLLAGIAQYYDEKMRCGRGVWTVIARDGEASSTAGNPVNSTVVDEMKRAHKQAKARAGEGDSDTVDVIEPVHIRAFFTAHFSGRALGACDPLAVMLHAALLMSMSLLLRFNELSSLTVEHLGRSEGHFTFSIPGGTKNHLKKKFYELVPWPTCVKLDPRYVPARLLCV